MREEEEEEEGRKREKRRLKERRIETKNLILLLLSLTNVSPPSWEYHFLLISFSSSEKTFLTHFLLQIAKELCSTKLDNYRN